MEAILGLKRLISCLTLRLAQQTLHNLAWKIAATLHGEAATTLLDSYEMERRPQAIRNAHQAMLRTDFDARDGFETGANRNFFPELLRCRSLATEIPLSAPRRSYDRRKPGRDFLTPGFDAMAYGFQLWTSSAIVMCY